MADAPLPTPHRARTALLANLAAVLERCDEQMVPAVYRSLGAAFSATPHPAGLHHAEQGAGAGLSALPIGGIAGSPSAPAWRQQRGGWLRTPLRSAQGLLAAARPVAREVASVLRIPTFRIIVLQGIMGSIPWSALVFLTLYLQLLGMSDAQASALVALFLAGTAFGGLIGGCVGDAAAKAYPQHGRIAVTQFSVGIGVPFAFLIFKPAAEEAGGGGEEGESLLGRGAGAGGGG
ncbi:hypothetical protein CHLNCDRAFT_55462 [Chlorella variabilis]|uniref:Major facilitator superfamily (MFS) profile domain-containing protein n=1 Tax=Chlorella variabilis TaxID=554065 RepID=E1ZTC7_CHLVA|nr:hypothetical protein CHLNCDRAFT_55462 [Chlorella variabilis]EFN50877.1 hypothetical protein CHLNCDRAFT_55462 [Chlorella variabilis]|eukprot:XP_005842979.1 hypothetical protein CHLNCDRAFT_55462 [Chlorella variabilis]